ncbi:MAG: hypothetical protein ACLSHC_14460 [Bilophila wadsworthia]
MQAHREEGTEAKKAKTPKKQESYRVEAEPGDRGSWCRAPR